MAEQVCKNAFKLKYGYFCELPKGHSGEHEATCPNPQFHQRWPDALGEPAEPSAAGEPPIHAQHCAVWHDESCNCGVERGNHPQEGACLLQSSEGREWEQSVKDAGEALRDLAKPPSKAPGVAAEPVREQLNEMFGKDKVDYAVNEATIANLRRQLAEVTEQRDNESIVRASAWKRAEAAEQKLAAALPIEEAIAVLAQKEVKQLLFDCRSSGGTSPKTFSESQLHAALMGFARAVLAMLKGER